MALSTPYQRSQQDLEGVQCLGMATSRTDERILCAFGLTHTVPVQFESCQTVPFGGVMLLLPFLLECGLLSYRNHYSQRGKGYYNFDSLFILIAFLYLCRIKSFEQSKQYSPGEFGKLIGYDRIPTPKLIRGMVHEITDQNQSNQWAAALSKSWIDEENPQLYYIDGHVQVYHGDLANLGKKYVSRQRLCLPGVMKFWINASDGSPYFFITAQVNEKMIEMLETEIIPKLVPWHPVSDEHRKRMEDNPNEPLFTLVFDREAYSPAFFALLWNTYRIAVITYRKNVKNQWNDDLFTEYETPTKLGTTKMLLHEKSLLKDECSLREVRKLNPNGHQTSIITTNKILPIIAIASHMFARWAQENFFRYMLQDYALDKILQYSVNEISTDIKVVNLEYSNITYKIAREREKINRKKVKLHDLNLQNPMQLDDKEGKKWMQKKLEWTDEIQQLEQQLECFINERKKIPCKIPLSQMPENSRYNLLNKESKILQNVIKMICYRAETAFASLLSPYYKRANQEIRTLVKSIIHTPINMKVDHENNCLEITLYHLANQRSNYAVDRICHTINDTNTIYPGTNLKLHFKIATM